MNAQLPERAVQLLIPSIPTYQRVTRPYGIKGSPIEEEDRPLLFAWLDEDVQDKVIEELSRQATEDNWWSSCYEMFHEFLQALGFADVDISFSGFWSQGDGASFTGTWSHTWVDFDKAREWQGRCQSLVDEIAVLTIKAKLTDDEFPVMTLTNRGHSVHEQSIDYEFDYTNMKHEGDERAEQFDEALKAWCVDLMCWIYHVLEAEYEYLSSREQVLEMIDANDYRFTADGDII